MTKTTIDTDRFATIHRVVPLLLDAHYGEGGCGSQVEHCCCVALIRAVSAEVDEECSCGAVAQGRIIGEHELTIIQQSAPARIRHNWSD